MAFRGQEQDFFRYFRGQVLSQAREYCSIGRLGNCGIRTVGSPANGKYSVNKGRKLATGLTMALAAAII
jgi:hypothetical protein